MSKTYVVTGGAGFIGSAFLWKLNSLGIENIIVVDDPFGPEKARNLNRRKFRDFIDKDKFLELVNTRKLGNDICAIVHMGACSSTTEADIEFLNKNNYEYSRSLAEYSLADRVRFIYASSAATYGSGKLGYSDEYSLLPRLEPLNHYGRSKHRFDMWVLENGLENKLVGLKFFNVFGPNEYHKGEMRSVVHKAYCQIKEDGEVKLFKSYRSECGDGEQRRDFIYVKDCVDAIWWFIENQNANGIFNIGSGKARTWNDLARAVFSALGLPPKISYIEMPHSIRAHYQYFTEARLERLRASGYIATIISLEDGVGDYVQQFLEQGERCL